MGWGPAYTSRRLQQYVATLAWWRRQPSAPYDTMGKKIQYIGRYVMEGTTLGKGNFAKVELATHGLTEVKVSHQCPVSPRVSVSLSLSPLLCDTLKDSIYAQQTECNKSTRWKNAGPTSTTLVQRFSNVFEMWASVSHHLMVDDAEHVSHVQVTIWVIMLITLIFNVCTRFLYMS